MAQLLVGQFLEAQFPDGKFWGWGVAERLSGRAGQPVTPALGGCLLSEVAFRLSGCSALTPFSGS